MSSLTKAPTAASYAGKHHGEDGEAPITITRSTYLFVLCASLNSANLGFDIGVSTEAARLIQNDMGLTRVQRELFIGSLNFWAMFGALLAQSISDRFGRRITFVIAAVGFILGIFIMVLSQSLEVLLIGRTFIGWGIGIGLAIDPLYISEVTPAKHRGELVTWSEIAINVGVVFGFSTGLFLSGLDDGTEWRVMFSLGAVLPALMIYVVLTIMPESPRWLVQQGREEEALSILQCIYPEGYDCEPLLASIKDAIQRDTNAHISIGWGFLCRPSPAVARMLLVGVGAPVAQQLVGIDAIQYYLGDVIAASGIESKEEQSVVLILLGLVKLGFVFVGGKTFDQAGRRVGLSISLLGMAAALMMVSCSYLMDSTASTALVLTGLTGYLAFFSIGMGPGAWLIPSEVFPNVIRAKAMSVAAFSSRVLATIMASTFLSIANTVGFAAFFFCLAIMCLLVFGFFYAYLPETKGCSLEAMALHFAEATGDTTVLEAEAELTEISHSRMDGLGRDDTGGGDDDVENEERARIV